MNNKHVPHMSSFVSNVDVGTANKGQSFVLKQENISMREIFEDKM